MYLSVPLRTRRPCPAVSLCVPLCVPVSLRVQRYGYQLRRVAAEPTAGDTAWWRERNYTREWKPSRRARGGCVFEVREGQKWNKLVVVLSADNCFGATHDVVGCATVPLADMSGVAAAVAAANEKGRPDADGNHERGGRGVKFEEGRAGGGATGAARGLVGDDAWSMIHQITGDGSSLGGIGGRGGGGQKDQRNQKDRDKRRNAQKKHQVRTMIEENLIHPTTLRPTYPPCLPALCVCVCVCVLSMFGSMV